MSERSEYPAVGIDVGGSFLKAGLVTATGEVVERVRRPVRKETREQFYAQLRELVESLIELAGDEGPIGAGIGIPGFIDRRDGRIEQSPNLPIIDGAPIIADLEGLLPIPVTIDNDANAAAWGEYWVGGGGDAELLVLLTLGSGIGGGIVWRGRVWHGAIGFAGEIGHTVISPGGSMCSCGRSGCIEAEFGDAAFARKASEALEAGRETSLAEKGEGRIYGKDVTDAAAAGDEVAHEIVESSSLLLGATVANVINMLNPDLVVLGGGLIGAADLLMPMIMEGVERHAISGALAACRVRPSALGNDAGLLGAAGLVLRKG
jgi:glucokinase